MSRLIDANGVVKTILAERNKIPRTVPTAPYELVAEKPFNHGNSMRGGIRKALRCIEQAPTVDAVPVVRCKDCKHYDMGVCLKIYSDGNMHTEAWQSRRPEDFCSYGERKD